MSKTVPFHNRKSPLWSMLAFIVCFAIFQLSFLQYSMVQVIDGEPLTSAIDVHVASSSKNAQLAGQDSYSGKIPVFYNLFVASTSKASLVMDIVSEQTALLRSEYHKPLFVQSMGGAQLDVPDSILLGHRANGTELVTLHSLWDFCRHNPKVEKVVYLHSKGSFTDSEQNRNLRKFLTSGALSEECALVDESTCNVCSSRFSPLPHPHTPGNMWLARCDYVSQLLDPFKFEEQMNSITSNCSESYKWGNDGPWCDGRDRWSAEHWIHSHPSVKPCDLHKDPGFVWSYGQVPLNGTLDVGLARAPRFDLVKYILLDECNLRGIFLDQRLYEYWELYGENPDTSWWGWNYLQTNRTFLWKVRKAWRWRRRNDCWKMVAKNGTEITTNH